MEKTEKNKKAIFNVVSPRNEWNLNLNGFVEETGVSDCGLFVEADSEEEARKLFESLIKVIKDNEVKISDE